MSLYLSQSPDGGGGPCTLHFFYSVIVLIIMSKTLLSVLRICITQDSARTTDIFWGCRHLSKINRRPTFGQLPVTWLSSMKDIPIFSFRLTNLPNRRVKTQATSESPSGHGAVYRAISLRSGVARHKLCPSPMPIEAP